MARTPTGHHAVPTGPRRTKVALLAVAGAAAVAMGGWFVTGKSGHDDTPPSSSISSVQKQLPSSNFRLDIVALDENQTVDGRSYTGGRFALDIEGG